MRTQMKTTLSLSKRNALNGATVLNGSRGRRQSRFPELTDNFVERVFVTLSAAAQDAARPGLCDLPEPGNANVEPAR